MMAAERHIRRRHGVEQRQHTAQQNLLFRRYFDADITAYYFDAAYAPFSRLLRLMLMSLMFD